jgi:hypothetical protein
MNSLTTLVHNLFVGEQSQLSCVKMSANDMYGV